MPEELENARSFVFPPSLPEQKATYRRITSLDRPESTRTEPAGSSGTCCFRVQMMQYFLCVCLERRKKKKAEGRAAQKCHPEDKYVGVLWMQPAAERWALALRSLTLSLEFEHVSRPGASGIVEPVGAKPSLLLGV